MLIKLNINSIVLKILYILSLLLLILISLLFIVHKKIIIFPNNKDFIIKAQSDKEEKGNSEITKFNMLNNKVIFTYKLKKGIDYPYALLKITPKSKLNIKDFDRVRIKIKSDKARILRFFLKVFVNGITFENNSISFLYFIKEIPVDTKKNVYDFAIKDFLIPSWWFDLNNLSEFDKRINRKISSVSYITIENNAYDELNVNNYIILNEIFFYNSNIKILIILMVLLVLNLFILTFRLILKSYNKMIREKYNKIILPSKNIKIENKIDEDLKKVMSYIGENYHNSNLTMEIASNACMIPDFIITRLLKKELSFTFSEYLNAIRLTEAKRLLKETDRQVIDIAYNVGYSNRSYFNRMFKKKFKLSPIQYREKNQMK